MYNIVIDGSDAEFHGHVSLGKELHAYKMKIISVTLRSLVLLLCILPSLENCQCGI